MSFPSKANGPLRDCPHRRLLRAGYTHRACGVVSSPFTCLVMGVTMRRAALVLLAASLVAFAPAPFSRKPRHPTVADDLRAMRGGWLLDHALLRGETVRP